MGYNGPILPPCQDLCVEWCGVGSKLLPCMGNEMTVLTFSLTFSQTLSLMTFFPYFLRDGIKEDIPDALLKQFLRQLRSEIDLKCPCTEKAGL